MQAKPSPRVSHGPLLVAAGVVTLALTGCLSSLQKHSAALAAATTPVVDQAAAAYRSANALYNLRVDYDAVLLFDRPTVYNPRDTQPLLSDKDIDQRLAVLEAFQCYVRSLVAITNGVSSPALDAASKSVGDSLTSLGNELAPSIEATFGLAVPIGTSIQTTVATTKGDTTTTKSSTSTTPPPDPVSPATRNGISTAANALGQFLVARKIKRELPTKIKGMDDSLQILCTLLENDLDVLQYEERLDYNIVINRETLSIREDPPSQQRRERIMNLPEIVRRQRNADQQLATLRAAIVKLALTHHALAADLQGNNPQSLKSKLDDLAAAGGSLGTFYSFLPAK